jgi:hypothetical protein
MRQFPICDLRFAILKVCNDRERRAATGNRQLAIGDFIRS